MPRVMWPLHQGRPCVEVVLTPALGGLSLPRTLLADTGAGTRAGRFELILEEDDCLLCGGSAQPSVSLTGAYLGPHPRYRIRVRLPALGFDQVIRAVGVPTVPAGFDGIAGFGFLNRFSYGNFGDGGGFGVEG